MSSKADLKIDWATHKSAKYACEKWHYSKTMPVPPIVKIGVWEKGKFIGVVLFSRGASPDLLKPYGLTQFEGCELTRVALTKHTAPVSRIIRIAIKLLRQRCPSTRLIVSFADASKNHHGGIYQAGGWLYAGRSAPSVEYWHKGKRWHPRQLSSKGYKVQFGKKRQTITPSQCDKIVVPGKHRYILPLDKEMKARVQSLSRPYPKRAESKDSVAPSDQLGEGSANLTSALHLPKNEIKT